MGVILVRVVDTRLCVHLLGDHVGVILDRVVEVDLDIHLWVRQVADIQVLWVARTWGWPDKYIVNKP